MGRLRRKQAAVRGNHSRRRKDSRTRPIVDETPEGNGVYYHCWHCGFTCNDERDTIGGAESNDRVTYTDYIQDGVTQGSRKGVSGGLSNNIRGGLQSVSMTLSGYQNTLTLVKADSDGNSVEPKHYFDLSTSGGCPFCGSANWRGDH